MQRRDFTLGLAATTGAWALPGCGDGIDVAEWTEEVLLHDKQMVTVWRRARARSSGFPNASRGADIDFELRFEPLAVRWKGPWSREPLSFELFDGVPHLALYIKDRESCRSKPTTDFSAQFLRWQNGDWIDVGQTAFPTDRALLNLSMGYWGRTSEEDYKGLIRWEAKRLSADRDSARTLKHHFEVGSRFCSRFNG